LLKDIASIQTGLFAKPSGSGEVVYLQAKHFDENGRLLSTLSPDLEYREVSGKHLLRAGDVLFAAKGTKNFATVYENHNPPAVASTSFFVIRAFQNTVLPDFLSWYLNNAAIQAIIKAQAKGTAIPSISKNTLENLEIPIPSIPIQQSILQIAKLRNKEKALKEQIERLREKQIQQQITNAIK
jgi:restriction endonuclease S subunit